MYIITKNQLNAVKNACKPTKNQYNRLYVEFVKFRTH